MKKMIVIAFMAISFLVLPAIASANPFSLLYLGVKGLELFGKTSNSNDSNTDIEIIQRHVMKMMAEIGHPLTFGPLYEAKNINTSTLILTYTGTIDNSPTLFSIALTHINTPDKISLVNYIVTWDDGIEEYKSYTKQMLRDYFKENFNVDLGSVDTQPTANNQYNDATAVNELYPGPTSP